MIVNRDGKKINRDSATKEKLTAIGATKGKLTAIGVTGES